MNYKYHGLLKYTLIVALSLVLTGLSFVIATSVFADYPPTVDSVSFSKNSNDTQLSVFAEGDIGCSGPCTQRLDYYDVGINAIVERITGNSSVNQWDGFSYYPAAYGGSWDFPVGFGGRGAYNQPSTINPIDTSSWPSGTYRFCATVSGSLTALWPEDSFSSDTKCSSPFTINHPPTSGGLTASATTSLTIFDVPDVTLQINGSSSASISAGSSAILQWTPINTNSGTSCSATGNWSGVKSSTPGSTYTESTGTLAAGSYTYNISCTGAVSSTTATKSVTLTVVPNAPTVNITANGTTGSITIPYNTSATIAWTSTNATSCNIGPSGWTGISGSQSTGNLITTTTYVETCNGPGGSANASVTVNVLPQPDFSVACSPPTATINQGSTYSFSLITTPSNGFSSAVTFSAGFSPSSGTLPTVSYTNNGAVPGATTIALINTTGLTSTGTYTITFTGIGGAQTHTCNVSLTVNPTDPPQPPSAVSASNSTACGTISVDWQSHATHDSSVTYEVYKSTTSGSGPWSLLTSTPYVTGQSSYVFNDGSPASGSNYYYVKAVRSTLSSSNVYTSPVSPQVCSVNVDFSNKDLFRVNNNTASAGADVENRCNGVSDLFVLPNQGVFRDGDKAYFRINVCNNGTQSLTGITVTEPTTLEGLTNLVYESSYTSPAGCVTGASGDAKSYTLSDLGPAVAGVPTICSFVVSATISSGGGPAGQLFRFQNISTITAAKVNKTLYTPKYLYSVGSGVPVRNETAP